VLARPYCTAWVESEPLRVAESQRENLGARAWLSGKGVVLRNGAVGVNAQHLSHKAVELLRLHPIRRQDAHPGGHRSLDQQGAVVGLDDTAAGAFAVEQILHRFEALLVGGDTRAGDMDVRWRALGRRIDASWNHRISEVDDPVRRELLVALHAEKALTGRGHIGRHPAKRFR
jgi:hypothetical protein